MYCRSILCTFMLSCCAFAQDQGAKSNLWVDKAALRQLLEPPKIHVQVTAGAFSFGEPVDAEAVRKRIDTVKSQLKGDPRDAEGYVELCDLYSKLKDTLQQREAGAKAVELLRNRLKEDPREGALWAIYPKALSASGQHTAALRAAERAVEIAPDDTRCWQNLAMARIGDAWLSLVGGRTAAAQLTDAQFQQLVANLHVNKPTPEQSAATDKCLQEAFEYIAKAIALAPKDAELQRARIAARLMEWQLRMALGQEERLVAFFGALAANAQALATLCPDDPRIHGLWACALTVKTLGADKQLVARVSQCGWFAAVPQSDDTRALQECLAKLERILKGENRKLAAAASQELATAHALLGEWKKAEEYARRALDLDDSHQATWDLFGAAMAHRVKGDIMAAMSALSVASVFTGSRLDQCEALTRPINRAGRLELVRLAEKTVRRFPTAKNRYILSTLYFGAFEERKAIDELRAAIADYPDDLCCRLGLAVMLLQQPDDNINEAGDHLVRANKLAEHTQDRQLFRDTVFTTAIYHGLIGETQRSWEWLEWLRQQMPEDEQVREAQRAFKK